MTYEEAKLDLFEALVPRAGTIFEQGGVLKEIEEVVCGRLFYKVLSYDTSQRYKRHVGMPLPDYWAGLQHGSIAVL